MNKNSDRVSVLFQSSTVTLSESESNVLSQALCLFELQQLPTFEFQFTCLAVLDSGCTNTHKMSCGSGESFTLITLMIIYYVSLESLWNHNFF